MLESRKPTNVAITLKASTSQVDILIDKATGNLSGEIGDSVKVLLSKLLL